MYMFIVFVNAAYTEHQLLKKVDTSSPAHANLCLELGRSVLQDLKPLSTREDELNDAHKRASKDQMKSSEALKHLVLCSRYQRPADDSVENIFLCFFLHPDATLTKDSVLCRCRSYNVSLSA